jgi:hypothetical protein
VSTQEFDSNFLAQVRGASSRQAEVRPVATADTDPTFPYRRGLANMADAVMIRVVELEDEAARLTDIAKKLRAAVVANT